MTDSTEIVRPASLLPAGSVVAGYRVIRQLPGDTGQESWLAVAGGRSPCVLTFCADDEAGRRRLFAHETVRSPHVLTLLDVATDADGRILLLTERTDWTLATFIASRAIFAAGEAVTVLAPLSAGLAAIHAAGLVHGRLGPSAALFTADGRPVIGRLDGLVPDAIRVDDASGAARLTAGAIADYRALAGVLRAVTDRVEEQARPGFAAIADWLDVALDENAEPDSLPAQLECRIFAEAAPLPIVLVADRLTPDDARIAVTGRRRAVVLPRLGPGRTPAVAIAAVRRLLHGRRLTVCVGVAALVLVVVAGLAAIPETDRAGHPATTSQTPAPAQNPPRSPSAVAGTAFTPEESETVTADDPEAAASALLALRARCAAVDAAECVSRFAEPGSALHASDGRAFSDGGSGALLVSKESRSRIEIVEEYGDAVLTRAVATDEKRQPVLVLVVRTDTGWRLRDLFEPD